MKAVTEFPGFVLTKALQVRTALTTEGKTPEEIQQSMGEAYKLEGDKLKYFCNAVEVSSQNTQTLKRVVVMRLDEGDPAPPRAVQLEELHYVPEFLILTAPKPAQKENSKGGRGGRRGGGGGGGGGSGFGKKESPWGLSPEEKAAKNAKKPVAGTNKPS